MSLREALGSRHTAKRRIQIRKYLDQRYQHNREFSDPFAQEDNETTNVLKVDTVKYSFKTDYIPEKDSDDEQDKDGILIIPNEDSLAEADRFIAALKIPKMKAAWSLQQPKLKRIRVAPSYDLLKEFREESAKLEKMKSTDVVESDNDEDLLI